MFLQVFAYSARSLSVSTEFIYLPNHESCDRIRDKLFRIVGIFHVSIWNRCSHTLTTFSLRLEYSPYLLGAVKGVKVIKIILYARHLVRSFRAVNAVCHCNEANIVSREYDFTSNCVRRCSAYLFVIVSFFFSTI